ncbi:hypothetical protein [Pelotomaculum sp. PtaB.Bin117]|uniref:hypothetical protein n=1 Tax=Pelotomaculum sp. PtaB.Bin117 TaxID=1811694 RepID=UPI0009D16D67|nr:hypothetical protein [Pelotomaculum sp. PtaB.Bin117]OPX85751.1 MAG: hypothetical protein A4E54_02243 [Pelotomaculum sp. PtaB.Bin117]
MAYERFKPGLSLTKQEKVDLMAEYISHYRTLSKDGNLNVLNRKIPREAFASALDRIGELLLYEAQILSESNGPVKEFLNENPLPPHMATLLPDDFRVFCLILNALKQWVQAESAATDTYLLGRTAKKTCRMAVDTCIVTGEALGENAELHHPLRDGRPPILLSKIGHSIIEGQVKKTSKPIIESINNKGKEAYINNDEVAQSQKQIFKVEKPDDNNDIYNLLLNLKHKKNRSWVHLRNGCLDILGLPVCFTTQPVKNISRQFARDAQRLTDLSYKELLQFLDERQLGFK